MLHWCPQEWRLLGNGDRRVVFVLAIVAERADVVQATENVAEHRVALNERVERLVLSVATSVC